MSKHLTRLFFLSSIIIFLIPAVGVAKERGYIGVGVGNSAYEGAGLDDSDTMYNIYLGYAIKDYLSFEVAYIDLGGVEDRVLPDNVISITEDTLFIDVSGATVAPVFQYKATESLVFSAMIGLAILDIEKKWSGGTVIGPLRNDTGGTKTEPFGGVRLVYKVLNSLGIGASWLHYEVDNVDVENIFGSIQIYF